MTRSRLRVSAEAISASRRGSRRKSRQPIAFAGDPVVESRMYSAGYTGAVGNGGRMWRGANWHPVASVTHRIAAALRMGGHRGRMRRRADSHLPLTSKPATNRQEEKWNEEDAEERCGEHSSRHACAHRDAAGGAGAGSAEQRHHAEYERERRHNDRPQAQLRGIERRIDRALATRLLLDRELHDEDRVLRGEADDRDQPDI